MRFHAPGNATRTRLRRQSCSPYQIELVRVLALDLGGTMGFAMHDASGAVRSGVVRLPVGGKHGYGARFLAFRRWLTENAGDIEKVFYEQVRHHAAVEAGHVYGGFVATLAAWAEARGIMYQGVMWGDIKRHATGKWHAEKHEVAAAMRAQGFKPADDNEADALALLHYLGRDPRLDPPRLPKKPKPSKKSAKAPPAADLLSSLPPF